MCKGELAAAGSRRVIGRKETVTKPRYAMEGRACAPALRTQGIKNTLTALSVFAWPISQFQHSLASLQLALQPFLSGIYDEMS